MVLRFSPLWAHKSLSRTLYGNRNRRIQSISGPLWMETTPSPTYMLENRAVLYVTANLGKKIALAKTQDKDTLLNVCCLLELLEYGRIGRQSNLGWYWESYGRDSGRFVTSFKCLVVPVTEKDKLLSSGDYFSVHLADKRSVLPCAEIVTVAKNALSRFLIGTIPLCYTIW